MADFYIICLDFCLIKCLNKVKLYSFKSIISFSMSECKWLSEWLHCYRWMMYNISSWMSLDSKAEHRFRETACSRRCAVAWLNVSWTPHLLKLQWWPYSKKTNLLDSFDINKKGSCVRSISASLKCVNSTVCNLRVKIFFACHR